ncbi:helix-turn-helix transcriptional regulator [Solidesulfovibrio sp.]|uniref:helix-turn-helix domain-containing protein n=1 Tax=Solidesulfovibrio sp. TaxID=2910990 RepID=UPI00260A7968|nr:helix-turn-helix transcriptional regulator [Solidesulfovibrio sp.]
METRIDDVKTVPLCFRVPVEKKDAVVSALKEYGAVLEEDEGLETIDIDEIPAGEALKGFRLHKGWTQIQLAEKTGISQRHISQMERGRLPIGKIRAKRFAEVFNADYRVFL